MIGSLRARLFAALAAFILMAGVVAGVVTFRWAFDQAIELQDAVLLQVGALAAANRANNNLPPQLGVDAEARVVVQEPPAPAGTSDASLPVSAEVPDGMQTIDIGAQEWRILVRTRADASRVAVGQITRYRNRQRAQSRHSVRGAHSMPHGVGWHRGPLQLSSGRAAGREA
jgi:two-component system, OmpR family, sensor kinase